MHDRDAIPDKTMRVGERYLMAVHVRAGWPTALSRTRMPRGS